jgi:site-specific DNA recombinase
MRCALYARFSTELQNQESISDQFRQCERVAKIQGLEIVSRFEDRGISGGTSERPGYQALLTAARVSAFEVIVCEDISRVWRNRSEYGQRSAELEDLGVHLLTCVGDDTRREGWGLVLGIKQAIAEAARREISYRTRRGMEGLALAGKSTGGKCYGYCPGEADVVRRIYDMAAAGDLPAAIAQTLNREGVSGPRGPRWSLNAAKRILLNPRYRGLTVWGRTETKGGAQDSRRKRHVLRPDGPLVSRFDPNLVIV